MRNHEDVCTCGDYRKDHENGTGRCRMPNDLCHGFVPCEKFTLFRRAAAPKTLRSRRERP